MAAVSDIITEIIDPRQNNLGNLGAAMLKAAKKKQTKP